MPYLKETEQCKILLKPFELSSIQKTNKSSLSTPLLIDLRNKQVVLALFPS